MISFLCLHKAPENRNGMGEKSRYAQAEQSDQNISVVCEPHSIRLIRVHPQYSYTWWERGKKSAVKMLLRRRLVLL